MNRVRPRLLTLIALGFSACHSVAPGFIDAEKVEADFRARSLSDSGLGEFIRSHQGLKDRTFPPPMWDLETLTLVAFYYHPDLDIARARFAQARAGVTAAGAWPNPTLGAGVGRGRGQEAGVSPWVYGFNLDMPVDFLWKRGYHVEQAGHLAEAALWGLAETAWRVRSRLRAALLDHIVAERDLQLREAEEAVRSEIVQVMSRRLEVGETFRLEVDRAQVEHGAARMALRAGEGRVGETRAALAAALGVPGAALEGTRFTWPDFEKPPSEEALSLSTVQAAGLLNRLDVRRTLAEYAASVAALQLELAKRYPDVSLGPGYEFEQGEKRFVLGLSIRLPVFDQNAGPIAEAEARRKEVAARFLAVQARAIAEMESALARYRSARKELEEAERTLAGVERLEKALRRAVELGESDRAARTGVRAEWVAASRVRLAALEKAQDALGRLEDAVQRPLGGAAPIPEPSPESSREGVKE